MFLRSVLQLLVIANAVPSSLIIFALIMEAVLTIATRRNIPEDGIFHSHRRETLKSYRANELDSVAEM
jgi:hypothetical protein